MSIRGAVVNTDYCMETKENGEEIFICLDEDCEYLSWDRLGDFNRHLVKHHKLRARRAGPAISEVPIGDMIHTRSNRAKRKDLETEHEAPTIDASINKPEPGNIAEDGSHVEDEIGKEQEPKSTESPVHGAAVEDQHVPTRQEFYELTQNLKKVSSLLEALARCYDAKKQRQTEHEPSESGRHAHDPYWDRPCPQGSLFGGIPIFDLPTSAKPPADPLPLSESPQILRRRVAHNRRNVREETERQATVVGAARSSGPSKTAAEACGMEAIPGSPPESIKSWETKEPIRYSKVDPNFVLVDAWKSIKEVIECHSDCSAYKAYDIDRDSPVQVPRGCSIRRPIVIVDSPPNIPARGSTDAYLGSPADRNASVEEQAKGALYLKWTPTGKKSSFLLPALHKQNLEDLPESESEMSLPIAGALLKDFGEGSSAGTKPIENGENSGICAVVEPSPPSVGLDDLLRQVDNLPVIQKVTLPAARVYLVPVVVPSASKEVYPPNGTQSGLPTPLDPLDGMCTISTQSMQWIMDDLEKENVPGGQDALVDYASDSGTDN